MQVSVDPAPSALDATLLFLEYFGLLIAASGSIWGTMHDATEKDYRGRRRLTRAGVVTVAITLLGFSISVTSSILNKRRAKAAQTRQDIATLARHQEVMAGTLAGLRTTTEIAQRQDRVDRAAIQRDLGLTNEVITAEQKRAAADRSRQMQSDAATHSILGQINRALHPFGGSPTINIEFDIDARDRRVVPYVERLVKSESSRSSIGIFGKRIPNNSDPAESELAFELEDLIIQVMLFRSDARLQATNVRKYLPTPDLRLTVLNGLPSLKLSITEEADTLSGCAGGDSPCSLLTYEGHEAVIDAIAKNLRPGRIESPTNKTFASTVDLAGGKVIVSVGDEIPMKVKKLELVTTNRERVILIQFKPVGQNLSNYFVADIPADWTP